MQLDLGRGPFHRLFRGSFLCRSARNLLFSLVGEAWDIIFGVPGPQRASRIYGWFSD